jgi:hypothetical protein
MGKMMDELIRCNQFALLSMFSTYNNSLPYQKDDLCLNNVIRVSSDVGISLQTKSLSVNQSTPRTNILTVPFHLQKSGQP